MVKTKSQIGKASRAAGGRFELKVRKDLESKGWIVSKWMNNVGLDDIEVVSSKELNKLRNLIEYEDYVENKEWVGNVDKEKWDRKIKGRYNNKDYALTQTGKLIPAKHKFRGPGIPMAIGTGFPDFIAFTKPETEWIYMSDDLEIDYDELDLSQTRTNGLSSIIGVEVKSNGYLDKTEKEKCKWLLDNNIFSKILIASKGTKRGEIIYTEYKEVKK